ncbi:EAL domain-containing protein [Methylophaga sp.]|uniref:bifunctional diguanylate cyclase/phosphodiesterase n=1 Tax=Methylophaga sp. TaxID=2024840 RepID=UPI003F699A54
MDYLKSIKLGNKIFLLCVALVISTMLAIQVSAWFSSNRFNQQQLSAQVDNAKQVLQQYLSAQERLLVTAANVLTADFGFIRAVATSDMQTINSVLHNHGARINADMMMLTDLSGKVRVSSEDEVMLDAEAIKLLIENPSKSIFTAIGDHVYQLILLPVKAPRVIAYSIVGFEIDEDNVQELKSLTGMDISFYQGDAHLLSSTFRMESYKAYYDALKAQTSSWLFIDRPAFLTEQITLRSAGESPVCVLLVSSLKPLYQQYDDVVYNNAILALIAAVIASLLSIIFAKSLTGPLSKLGNLAEDYAKGNYTRKIELEGSEEIQNLQTSFQQMGSEIKKREDEIRYQASHDILTGLINAHTLEKELPQYLQLNQNQNLVLIAFSIYNFRLINDRLGSDIANACLKGVASRLKTMGTVNIAVSARLDGVEFFSVIRPKQAVSPMQCVDIFLAELEHDFLVADLNIKLDLNAGITLYPEHGNHSTTMLRRTTIALDAARNNKQRIHCYEDGEDELHLERISMIESLRKVLLHGGNDELFMVYQPKVSMNGREEIRTEALIRWRRADDTYVSPEVFVNLAEEASLIVDLTYWVVEAVMKEVEKWHSQGTMIGAAINVSAQDLSNPDFESFISQSCEKYGISPSEITIEITERDIMHDEASVVMSLRNLKNMGFIIAIDDYGIGQSSLSKLKGLPVDEIKIDKSFIMTLDQSPKDQLIVKSTIELAHGLGFKVVAEGVENEASLTILRKYECDYIQGYYLSRPIKSEAIIDWHKDYVENNSITDNAHLSQRT